MTHRPAVVDGWSSDFTLIFQDNHVFLTKANIKEEDRFTAADASIDAENDRKLKNLAEAGTPFVYFASMQDLRGSKIAGGKYEKNIGVFTMDWDLIIYDEAHEGTQTEIGLNVQRLLEEPKAGKCPKKVLQLSGTPYNLINQYEDDNVYSWDYVMEQRCKREWDEKQENGLPAYGYYEVDGEMVPVRYRYIPFEIGAYSDTDRTPYHDGYDWLVGLQPDAWDGDGSQYATFAPIEEGQDQDRLVNIQATDLEVDKEWESTPDNVEEVYVKIWRQPHTGGEIEDLTEDLATRTDTFSEYHVFEGNGYSFRCIHHRQYPWHGPPDDGRSRHEPALPLRHHAHSACRCRSADEKEKEKRSIIEATS